MKTLNACAVVILIFAAGGLFGSGHWILALIAVAGALYAVHDSERWVSNWRDLNGRGE